MDGGDREQLIRNKMVLPQRSPDRAGIPAGWFVLLLLAVGQGTVSAFAPPPTCCSPVTSSHNRGVPCGLSLISTQISQRRHSNLPFRPVSLPFAKATATTDGDEAVHAISRAFLAELEASGRVMTKHDQKWWARFGELEEYKHERGDCNVPQSYKDNPQLGEWVNNQRRRYQQEKLSSERIGALERIGFEWTRPKGWPADDAQWWKRFAELEEYKQEHGDCNVPYKYKANPQLGNWVFTQRQSYKKNVLSSERVEALESIGFEWTRPLGNSDDEQWWKRLRELKEYKKMHGDCNVRINYQANPMLAKWVMNQRARYHRFIDKNCEQSPGITEERIDALNKIGFEWRLRERPEWDGRFEELVTYKEEHGDTLVLTDARGDSNSKYRALAQWVHTQRQQYRFLQEGKHSHLTDERIEKLNRIGFVWDAHEAAWDERYAELVSYKKIHGDTLVSRQGSQLGNWVDTQRKQYQFLQKGKHSNLTDERIEKLNQIGFVWSLFEAAWEEKFAELVDFKIAHGHTDVPKSWEDQQLFSWVSVQRREYRKLKEGKMTGITKDRIQRLEDLGFEWRSKKTYSWKQRLGELRDFYNENGIGPVPHTERSLYRWVWNQKKEYDKYVRGEKTSMDEERIKDLESIGFFEVHGK